MTREEQQYLIEQANNPNIKDIGEVSDGYHTFNSLYNQRLCLWAALVKAYNDKAWKTRRHHDGEPCFDGGWFLVGISTPAGDYTYHYELKDWNLFDCKVLDKAPEFDGHTDKDVTRVLSLHPNQRHQWYDAQGDNVPAYGREVIVIGRDGKVFYGHRPNPKEVTMVDGKPYHTKTYDKNGWNWPNIALWLDVEVPDKLIDEIATEYFEEQKQLSRKKE